ncbi:protein shisa-9B [Scleropages formosus]|uniref:Shisa family member 9b n=1 Tax=Scleropages formosus TaxID=113540 RepID=A0A8C9V539_SCLFO|nr:protein shisa-9B-like [Scleropages formosus]
MRRALLLLGYVWLKAAVPPCGAEGGPGPGFVVVSGSNGSRDADGGPTEGPHTEDRCRGYYDVMGQWDPPFVCRTGAYLYCCGTCGFRFCCAFKSSRLDQSTCKNYDTPLWMMTGRPPSKKSDPAHDPTRDKTNMIVYVVCGVVAVMALVGIFTKLGLEKAHRPHRENMTRALASVMRQQGPCPGESMEREEALGAHVQHYENLQARAMANNLQPTHMNNVGPTPTLVPTMAQPHHYATLGAIPHIYEQPQPTKELNKYASLKAVAEKANDNFYVNRRHLTELTTKGSLPLHPVRLEPQPGPAYGTMLPVPKQNGHKPRVARSQGPQPLPYASHTIASTAMLRGWNGSEMVGHRTLYGAPRKHGTMDRFGELHVSRSQHYLSPQPYFVTNSKTEVTV